MERVLETIVERSRPELEAVCAQLGLTVEDLPARLWD